MDKRTEQVTGKFTQELKDKILDYCRANDISESELLNIAVIHFFVDLDTRGLIQMYAKVIGA